MASFVDQILTFNPHISQVPVDDYTRVGMIKQGQYDTGVKEIQNQIANIQGLDVIHPLQKEYLQSSLGNMQEQLKRVAGADFSNTQVVGSVGGLATKIAKNPIVQNAVFSTSNYRKGLVELDDARKAGKSAPENEWDYNDKANKWLTTPDVKASFNGKYVPYTDLNKKALEVLKALHADSKMQEIPFVRNMDGSIDYGKTAAAMTKEGVEGISAAKIENAIKATLNPQDLDQLSISGRYTFKNHDANSLIALSDQKYKNTVAETNSMIDKLSKFAELNKSDVALYNKTQLAISDLRDQLGENGKPGNLAVQHDREIQWIKQNPDEAKAQIYKDGFIKQFGNAFSWEKSTLEWVDNPLTKQHNWEKDYALDVSKFKLNQAEFGDKVRHEKVIEAQGWEKLGIDRAGLDIKLGKIYGAGGFKTDLGLSADVPTASTAMATEIQKSADLANNLTNTLASQLGVKSSDLEAQIKEYQTTGKTKIPTQARTIVDQIIEARNQAKAVQNIVDQTTEEVKNRTDIKDLNKSIDQQLAERKSVAFNFGKGWEGFTPKELLSLANKQKEELQGSTSEYGYTSTDINTTNLTPKEKRLVDAMNKDAKLYQTVHKELNSYRTVVDNQKKSLETIDTEIEKALAPRALKWVPKVMALETPKEEVRNAIENIANTVSTRIMNDTEAASNKGDAKQVSEWLADETNRKGLKYQVFNQGNNYELWVNNGKKFQKIPITNEEAYQIPGVKPVNDEDVVNRLSSRNGSTNVIGRPEGAMFQRYKFGNVRDLNVVGDLQRDLSNPEIVYPVLRLRVAGQWKTIQADAPLSISNAKAYINAVTDQQIKDLFIKHNPELKDVIQNLK